MKNLAVNLRTFAVVFALILATAGMEYAQTSKRNVGGTPSPAPEVKISNKRNERPAGTNAIQPANNEDELAKASQAAYHYEFTQKDFVNSRIVIAHDDSGKGTISFERKGYDEPFSDPLQVSPEALGRIRAVLDAMNFFDSIEDYQYEKDYSHLGTARFKFKRNGKERTVAYNYTTKKEARELGDEYRRLANQYIWMFDIAVARENQPLSAPGLLDALDSLFRRNEVSDKHQMLPLLRELSNDERIPLIARNHAERLIKQIGTAKK